MGRSQGMSPWPNVTRFIDRHGHERWRWRKKGYPTAVLHGEPGSPQFMAELEQAKQRGPLAIGEDRVDPGSFSALCVDYYQSAAWRSLKPVTQRTYKGELERFRSKNGALPARLMRRQDVLRFMDQKSATPAAANNLLKVLRLVMGFALERGRIPVDPTHGVKRIRRQTEGFRPWSEDDIAAFEARWPSGTKARLAFALMLETGQRRGDAVRLGRQHVRGGFVRLRQAKTGAELAIPVTLALQAEIDKAPKGHLTFLVTEAGAAFTSAGFGMWFRERCNMAGLRHLSAHGLRKAAARRLAEAGCTAHEIAAITGHKSLQELTVYTRSADQERLATSAIAKTGKRTD